MAVGVVVVGKDVDSNAGDNFVVAVGVVLGGMSLLVRMPTTILMTVSV